jgi:predicted transcriptional regulator
VYFTLNEKGIEDIEDNNLDKDQKHIPREKLPEQIEKLQTQVRNYERELSKLRTSVTQLDEENRKLMAAAPTRGAMPDLEIFTAKLICR